MGEHQPIAFQSFQSGSAEIDPGITEKNYEDWYNDGWWFGTFFHILGIIVPTDFDIFQDG